MSKRIFSGGRRSLAGTIAALIGLVTVIAALAASGAMAGPKLLAAQRAARVPAGARALGAAASDTAQSGVVALKPRDPAALAAYVAALSTRGSGEYHHYLAPGQFAGEFGPSRATIAAVSAQLRNEGLAVDDVSADGMLIGFSGSTAEVESAFGTHLERYRTATGTSGEETSSAIQLPASISSEVSGVVGLNTLVHPTASMVPAVARGERGSRAARADATADSSGAESADSSTAASADSSAASSAAPISSYPSGSPDPCAAATQTATKFGGYSDDEVANAYGAFGLYQAGDLGAGVHVGLYELEPYASSDITTFDDCYFGAANASTMVQDQLHTYAVDGGQPTGDGSGEAVLDIEDVSALAPGADIDVYEAPDTDAGALDEYSAMVNQDRDQIISTSWGICEPELEAYEPGVQESEFYLFEQAAAQGQTVLAATGDSGNDACDTSDSAPTSSSNEDPLSVSDPASQPDVVAVGGTSLADAGAAGQSESVWDDPSTGGAGGGGISASWEAPAWQQLASGFPTPSSAVYSAADQVESSAQARGISDQNWATGFCQIALGNTTPCRTLPDVSADADPDTGITVYSAGFATFPGAVDGGWYQAGGTSSAAPIWAAALALADADTAACTGATSPGTNADGQQTGGIGFAAPLLYQLAETGDATSAFHDVTTGDNDVDGFDSATNTNAAITPSTYAATTGYDLASGLGTPRLTDGSATSATAGLAAELCAAVTSSSRPLISSLSASSGPTAGGNSLTITGTGFGSSAPTVSVGSAVLPAASVTASSNTSITITLPPASAGAAQIIVTTGGSTSAGGGLSSAPTTASRYSYVATSNGSSVPTVTSVGPDVGLASDPAQVTIYGSGFDPSGDTISFGGQQTTTYSYVSSDEIELTPPAESSSTDCLTAGGLALENSDSTPADDVCQSQVSVENTAGNSSNAGSILPLYEGPTLSTGRDGSPEVPSGYEIYPQDDEYDYVPAPTITGVSTDAGPGSYASAQGTSIITITGTGLNGVGLDWVNVGSADEAASQDMDIVSDTGTQLQIQAPALAGTIPTAATPLPLSVASIAGSSGTSTLTYAGIPDVSGVSLSGSGTSTATYAGTSYPVGPDGGGSSLSISGAGFTSVDAAAFLDASSADVLASRSGLDDSSDSTLDLSTPSLSGPAIVDLELMTNSGSFTVSAPAAQFLAYAPGDPSVTSVSGGPGSASGGTAVTITGQNLGCATAVFFGSSPAQSFSNGSGGGDCGSSTSLSAVAPAGSSGTDVPVTVQTVAGEAGGFNAAQESAGSFAYAANPTQTVTTLGPTTTVTTPGPTVTDTVTTPPTTSTVTVTKIYDCSIVTVYRTRFVIKKVRVRGHLHKVRVRERIRSRTRRCVLARTTTTRR